jgi:hypothetical protein
MNLLAVCPHPSCVLASHLEEFQVRPLNLGQ